MLEKIPLNSTRVHFVGSLPYGKYLKLLQASDVHVYLTRPFVLSWSMLEAMSCGCVVVASDTEPVREVIKEGVNGFLTDFFNPEQIAHKVLAVLSYPSFVKEISINARNTIVNRFSLQKLLPAHLKLILSYV
jgi:glycosyltransferase involved in cell wall biosynthesis